MTNKNQIYGITGAKGSGKDSFAKLVQEYNPAFTIIRFADDLKWMTHRIFDFPLADMEDQEAKARKFEKPLSMDAYVPAMALFTGLEVQPRNMVAHNLREILQFFGSEYVRLVCGSYWVDRVVTKIEQLGSKVLITDVRFENEAEAIRALGGNIIRIARVDLPPSGDGHISEKEMESIKPDLTLNTLTGKFDIQKKAANLVASNKINLIDMGDFYTY